MFIRYQVTLAILLFFAGCQALLYLPTWLQNHTKFNVAQAALDTKTQLVADLPLPSVQATVAENSKTIMGWARSAFSGIDLSMPSFDVSALTQYLPEPFFLEIFGLVFIAALCVAYLWHIFMVANQQGMEASEERAALRRRIAELERELRDKPTTIIDMTGYRHAPAATSYAKQSAPVAPISRQVEAVAPISQQVEAVAQHMPQEQDVICGHENASAFLQDQVRAAIDSFCKTGSNEVSIEMVTFVTMILLDLDSALRIFNTEGFSAESIDCVLYAFNQSVGDTIEAVFKPGSKHASKVRAHIVSVVLDNLYALLEVKLGLEEEQAAIAA